MSLKSSSGILLITLYFLAINNEHFGRCDEVNNNVTSSNTIGIVESPITRQKRDLIDDILSYFFDDDYFDDDDDGDTGDNVDKSPTEGQKYLICSNCTVIVSQGNSAEQTTTTTTTNTEETTTTTTTTPKAETTKLMETTTMMAVVTTKKE